MWFNNLPMPEFDVAQYARNITEEHYHALLDKFTNAEDKLVVLTWILRALLEERTQEARTDDLTGFVTGNIWRDELSNRLKDDHTKIAVASVDLTNFKRLNDACGQEVGNQTLQIIAQHLSSSLGGFNGRLGGDEFGIILDMTVDLTDYTHRLSRANRLSILHERFIRATEELHDFYPHWRKEYGFDIAVGFAIPGEKDSAKDAFRKAEIAMKAMKDSQHDEFGAYRPK